MDKKQKIYSAIAGVFFLILSYWLIQKLVSSGSGEMWSYIPSSAVVVIESSHMHTQWEEIKGQDVTTFLQNFELVNQFTPQFNWLDSILRTKDYTLEDLFGEKEGIVSFHFLRTQRTMEGVVYLPLLQQDKSFIKAFSSFFHNQTNGYTLKQENTISGEYWELYNTKKGSKVFFVVHENIFIGTYSLDLIKEVLTQIETGENDLLERKEKHDLKNSHIQHTQMYVNLPLLSKMFAHYVAPEDKDLLAALELFAEHTFLDVKPNNKILLLHGFTYNTQNWFFLNCFSNQKPMPFELSSLISNRTLTLSYLGIENGKTLQEKLKDYWWERGIDMEENWSQIEGEKQIDYTELYEELHGMAAYTTVENPTTHLLERVLYLPAKDIQRMKEIYTKFAESTYSDIDDMNISNYKGYDIVPINIQDFSYLMFGEYFKGFDNTFFTKIQNNIVIASSEQALKLLINDINTEKVWGRSSSHTADLEELFSSANVGLYINPNKILTLLENVLSLEGKNILQNHRKQLNPIKALSLQFSASEEGVFYTDWGVRIGKVGKIERNNYSTNSTVTEHKYELWRQDLNRELISKPFVVKNHETKKKEIFVQDENHHVVLLSNQGKVLWDVDVKSPIIGDVHQVDIYKNSKLQYLFTTQEKVYCLDRRGRNVLNFPFSVNNDKIKSMALIDYDDSKKYRILVSTNQQELRMYDIEGNNLKGWNPQKIDGELVVPPLHMRVKGKDVIFALQQNGEVYLWNRRGKSINKFPKKIGEKINAPIFTAKGKTINSSTFSFTTVSGKIQKYNLKGNRLFTKQMASSEEESLYMILSPNKEEYALVKQTDQNLYFYNNHLKEQFIIPSIENYQVSKAQYYPLRKGKGLYVNYSDQKAYFHLEENRKYLEQEIITPQKISLLYTGENKYIVYKIEGTKVIAEEVRDLKKLY